jgi:DNA processing protein
VPGERRRRRALAWPAGFGRTPADRDAALVLASLRGISTSGLLEVAQHERTASAVLDRVRRGQAGSDGDRVAALALRPDDIRRTLDESGARFVPVGDDEYPASLEHLADPPLALFVRGRPVHAGAGVAIVGARACSGLGRDVATELGRRVAGAGLPVVSGAARGIDTAAHEGALAAAGVTIAVLGGGIAPVPARSRSLVDRVLQRGTVVSEYAPGVPPDGFRFPARNRIVAALSRALVVVEGGEHSGSLISAEHALELGRDVFAVPGAVTSPLSAAPHRLIREGAGLIRDADDLLAELGLGHERKPMPLPLELPLAERAALDALRGPTLPDVVAREIGVGVPDALGLLMRLEVRGLVRTSGGRFEPRFVRGAGSTTEV